LTDRPLKILSLRYLHVDPANRKAVVDAAKKRLLEKATGSKEKTAGKLKTEGAVKILLRLLETK
jgi:hypothetical protein